jgi:hypothetical protein
VRKRRAGIKVFEDIIGMGDKVERQRHYRMSLRMWLNKDNPIIWTRGLSISFSTEILEGRQRLTDEYRVDASWRPQATKDFSTHGFSRTRRSRYHSTERGPYSRSDGT